MALLPLGSWSSEGPFLSGSRFPPQSEAGVRTPVREVATSAPGGFPLPASVFPGVSLSCQEIPFEERMGTCICMAESPCCPPESITSLLISYAAAAKSLQSCPTLCDPIDSSLPDSPSLDSPGKNTGVGNRSVLQSIFPTQELNPGFLLCRQILYHLSYEGSPLFKKQLANAI